MRLHLQVVKLMGSIMVHLWVRAEQRKHEQRVGISPDGVNAMLSAGHRVTVERSQSRAIGLDQFQATGCEIADEGSWEEAPDDAIIFGLKELNEDGPNLRHRHIMFGHAYKGQSEGPALLKRFRDGGGSLYDLEYLVEKSGRRIAAFGYWAGFAGAAVGMKVWLEQQKSKQPQKFQIGVYDSSEALVDTIATELASVDELPTAIVIGALGRVGSGTTHLFDQLGISSTKWDIAETASGGPFPEILDHTIFVNCILASPQVPVFVPKESLKADRKLTVIADVSCDPNSDYNPIPIYDRTSSFADPYTRVANAPSPLDVTAIDNLPSMLPVESSLDYSEQLLPYLLKLDQLDGGVWGRAHDTFKVHMKKLGT